MGINKIMWDIIILGIVVGIFVVLLILQHFIGWPSGLCYDIAVALIGSFFIASTAHLLETLYNQQFVGNKEYLGNRMLKYGLSDINFRMIKGMKGDMLDKETSKKDPRIAILEDFTEELVMIGYSMGETFMTTSTSDLIINQINSGKKISFVLLRVFDFSDPSNISFYMNDQVCSTELVAENRDPQKITNDIKGSLIFLRNCKKRINEQNRNNLKIYAFDKHFYFTGMFADSGIIEEKPVNKFSCKIRIQLKANFVTQHKGMLLIMKNTDSVISEFYIESCKKILTNSEEITDTKLSLIPS